MSAGLVWEGVRRDQLELIAPKCSHHVSASVATHVEGEYRLHGLHRRIAVAASSERQRWTDTVGVDDSLSRDLVTTTVSVLTDLEWLAHAAPPRTPASRSTGNGDAQESEQGVLAVEFRDDSRCKKSRSYVWSA